MQRAHTNDRLPGDGSQNSSCSSLGSYGRPRLKPGYGCLRIRVRRIVQRTGPRSGPALAAVKSVGVCSRNHNKPGGGVESPCVE